MQDFNQLPEIRPEVLALLGGSNLVYLGQKMYNLLRGLPKV